mgnify:CR=1 FL=1
MASAPRPGIGKRIEVEAQRADYLNSGFRIFCGAENKTVEILFGDLASEDEVACMNQVGLAPSQLMDQTMGHTAVLIFYWLALRQTKDTRTLKQIFAKYGTPRLFMEAGFEAWGLGLLAEDDDEEVPESVDPTQPAGPSETPGPPGPSSTASTPGTSAAPAS